MRSSAILFLVLFFCSEVFSAEIKKTDRLDSVRLVSEKILYPLVKQLYSAKTDSEKEKLNSRLLAAFRDAITIPETFDYQFDSLQKDIGILHSPDKKFRIIHWNIVKDDGTFEYFGFLQSKHIEIKKEGRFKSKNEVLQLYPLTDKSSEIKNPENVITDNKKWFGMLYHKIIHTKVKSKDYYTLLGWDGNDKFTQKKIIEVITFDKTGVPHFGADIFNYQKKFPKRIIFEYSASCSMSLKYSTKKDSIVFGHLAPLKPQFEGQYQYYCSDMSFDGFGFKKGKWNYGQDLNAVNERDENDKFYNDPKNKRNSGSQSNKMVERKSRKSKKQ